MIIKYIGDIFGDGRDGMLCRAYVDVIATEHDLSIDPTRDGNAVQYDKYTRMVTEKGNYRTVIHQMNPSNITIEKGKVNVGIVDCKTTIIPDSWRKNLYSLDYILTSSKHSAAALSCVNNIPECILVNPPLPLTSDKMIHLPTSVHGKTYMLVPEMMLSCNWVESVYTFINTFASSDDVTLVVCTTDDVIVRAIDNMLSAVSAPPTVIYLPYSNLLVDYLYSTPYSAGVDYTLLSAISNGIPVITSNFGAPTDYLSDTNSLLIVS
jgi:hypothetical protein